MNESNKRQSVDLDVYRLPLLLCKFASPTSDIKEVATSESASSQKTIAERTFVRSTFRIRPR